MLSFFSTKCQCFFCTFCQNYVCKNLVLELWSKNLRMIPQDSLNHNISQKHWGIKLNFWIWLEVREKDVVTLWLIGGTLTQTGCNEKPCSPKIFKANKIAWFFYNKFKHHDQHQNQHHDWNLLNKFWLLITFGVLFKVSLKDKLKGFLKFKI